MEWLNALPPLTKLIILIVGVILTIGVLTVKPRGR